ncbi:MAG TPA: serine hydrolase domain-containing protein [Methylomirabilota bacterium]|nr:serine hydrolase domain-containing protein [Methylomirabilota bacterium]
MNRREFIKASALALGATAQGCVSAGKPSKKVLLADAFDHEMKSFMEARHVPGGALAVVKDRRLVYARGYGWADRDAKTPVKPDSLFRIASISKPITGVAVMKLIEDGKLSLDTRAFPLLNMQPAVMSFRDPEPRLRDITIRQLLQHTSGWDRDKSFDPMFRPERIARATNTPPPATPVNVIRYMLSRELDFDPGTRYAYSNFGYCVLGRVIESVTGASYEQFVQNKILAPIGIKRMRIGASLEGKQARSEVRYYTSHNTQSQNVFSVEPQQVPQPYGGFHLEAMDAHGGWIASAVDLARFATALDDPKRSPLKTETFATMYAPPPAPVSRKTDGSLESSYYGCGWLVRPVGNDGKANYWHNGSLPGTNTWLVRRWDGLTWAMLFNQRSEDKGLPDNAIDSALHRAAAAVTKWPAHDLFSRFS